MRLAILGSDSRGNDIITKLVDLGGVNSRHHFGIGANFYYFIDQEERIIRCNNNIDNNNFVIFTIEEFEKRYPYKVGDNVVNLRDNTSGKVIGMRWDNFSDSLIYTVETSECTYDYPVGILQKAGDLFQLSKITAIHLQDIDFEDKVELQLGDYELREENGKYYAVKKKPQYPKTYKECCDVLGLDTMDNDAQGYKADLIIRFQELLIARGAYWKIAGEQMGLGKPWEPQFENCSIPHYCIFIDHIDEVCIDCFYGSRCLLAFPTAEMCDAFYENFKDLIEACKELL